MDRLRIAVDQPGWVWRGAIGVVAFIVLLPIILLVVLALVAGVIVFGALALVAMLVQRARDMLGGGSAADGRENVRVVVRRD
jgi:hypothetical protein